MKSNAFEIQFQDELEVTGLGVDSITEIDMIPKVELREADYMYTLTGMLLLKGKYKPVAKSTPSDIRSGTSMPWLASPTVEEDQKLDKAFPVRVMIPVDRVEVKENVSVYVDNIQCQVKDRNTVGVSCRIVVEGISIQDDSSKVHAQEENQEMEANETDYNPAIDDNQFIRDETNQFEVEDDWKAEFSEKQRNFPWFNEKETQSDFSQEEQQQMETATFQPKPYSFLEDQEQRAYQSYGDQASELRRLVARKEEELAKMEETNKAIDEQAARDAAEAEAKKKAAEEQAKKEAAEAEAKKKAAEEQAMKEAAEAETKKKGEQELARKKVEDQTQEQLQVESSTNDSNEQVVEQIEQETTQGQEVEEVAAELPDIAPEETQESLDYETILETPTKVKVKFSELGVKDKVVNKDAEADGEETESSTNTNSWWKAWAQEEKFKAIKYYVIQEDDDINKIAEAYKVSRLELISANRKLEDGEWRPGMRIRIPTA